MYKSVYIYIYTHTCTCACACIYIYIYISCIYHIYIYVCVHVCVCIYDIYIYIYTHTYKSTHIIMHIHMGRHRWRGSGLRWMVVCTLSGCSSCGASSTPSSGSKDLFWKSWGPARSESYLRWVDFPWAKGGTRTSRPVGHCYMTSYIAGTTVLAHVTPRLGKTAE